MSRMLLGRFLGTRMPYSDGFIWPFGPNAAPTVWSHLKSLKYTSTLSTPRLEPALPATIVPRPGSPSFGVVITIDGAGTIDWPAPCTETSLRCEFCDVPHRH